MHGLPKQRMPWNRMGGILATLVLLAMLAPAPARAQLHERLTQDDEFRVFGEDAAAVATVRRIAMGVADWAKREAGLPAPAYPVGVNLVRLGSAESPHPAFGITRGPQVGVRIAWNEHTQFDQVVQALVTGYFRQWASSRGDTQPPVWVELAGGLEALLHLRPALVDGLSRAAQTESPRRLSQLRTMAGPFSRSEFASNRLQAFILARFFLAHRQTLSARRQLWQTMIVGASPMAVLAADGVDWAANPVALEQSWAAGYINFAYGRRTPVGDLDVASELLSDLAAVVVEYDGEEKRYFGSEVFDRRQSPPMRAAIEAQLRRLKVEALVANPVHRNAFLSLAACYEAILAGDRDQFTKSFDQFIGDFKEARALSNRIDRLLAW